MIASVTGVITERGPISVVEVGGIGLAVSLPAGDAERLPAVGDTVRLWTHLAVREDAWTLFGFLEQETRTMYRLLLSVSGVGPKVALGMLSGASAAEIAAALHRGDEKTLVKLPGIGKKSAARLVVELSSKVPADLLVAAIEGHQAESLKAPLASGPGRTAALEMLGSMGLTSPRADQVLDTALAANPALVDDPVSWVRAALQHLS
jgi:holliday junction DNA helicase RuvA